MDNIRPTCVLGGGHLLQPSTSRRHLAVLPCEVGLADTGVLGLLSVAVSRHLWAGCRWIFADADAATQTLVVRVRTITSNECSPARNIVALPTVAVLSRHEVVILLTVAAAAEAGATSCNQALVDCNERRLTVHNSRPVGAAGQAGPGASADIVARLTTAVRIPAKTRRRTSAPTSCPSSSPSSAGRSAVSTVLTRARRAGPSSRRAEGQVVVVLIELACVAALLGQIAYSHPPECQSATTPLPLLGLLCS